MANNSQGSWVRDLRKTHEASPRFLRLVSFVGNQFHHLKLDGFPWPPTGGVRWSNRMTILKWALIFFLVSVVAGILGFTGISAASADVARFLFYVFVVIFLVLLILGLTIFRV
jgi:uncharacterized membrane protein YtjA (UPF0391 family)